MGNLIGVLEERGFIERTTHEEELREYLESGKITGYIGFDPTASSLHVGSLVPIMALAHMQREGHRPLALVGGGTGLVGDPSGKTEMRKMLTPADVDANAQSIKKQLSRYIDFDNERALLLNNADWLVQLEYIPFLRDVGRHFSVNRMIKAESCRLRLDSEEGLSFIEFNYMVLQAYDFLILSQMHDCRLQMGGSDQWGNIVAGIELIRRMRQETAFGITFPLITTSSGAKMGKTAQGAIWLDANRTSSYDYYQFWINTDDPDVGRFLALFTFLPMDEIRRVQQMEGEELNAAKTVLAFEATKLAHGESEAVKAFKAATSLFGTRRVPASVLPSSKVPRDTGREDDSSMPRSEIDFNTLKAGFPVFQALHDTGLAKSKGAARRLIEQGGAYLNGKRVASVDTVITEADLENGEVLLGAGKKRFHKICIKTEGA